jgi:hypothetical protein
VAVLGRFGGKTFYSPVPGLPSPNAGTSYLSLRRLDFASNFPQIPEKLAVAPIAPNTKEAVFEEFALSIDGTLDCAVRP